MTDAEAQILQAIRDEVKAVATANATFSLPAYNSQTFTYIGATNNVSTQVFKQGGVTVATLTYTYVAAGAADNDKILTITQS